MYQSRSTERLYIGFIRAVPRNGFAWMFAYILVWWLSALPIRHTRRPYCLSAIRGGRRRYSQANTRRFLIEVTHAV